MELRMRFPGGRKKALTFSYDDGVEQDIRLIEIMKKNDGNKTITYLITGIFLISFTRISKVKTA